MSGLTIKAMQIYIGLSMTCIATDLKNQSPNDYRVMSESYVGPLGETVMDE